VAEARDGLIAQFSLRQVQSQAILDMQLQRLTGLERQKILDELAELLAGEGPVEVGYVNAVQPGSLRKR
jgi:DNA gyrase/topoisomerase IV subunit A